MTGEAQKNGRTLREARAAMFEADDLGPDGGYGARWVKLKSKPFPLYFPNTRGRVRAVRVHDLHHILTGYGTDWVGEAEIGAWEIASGCRGYTAAWVLNLAALAIGVVPAPRRVFRAFVRGRHTSNLYGEGFSEALLDERVEPLRGRLDLDRTEFQPAATDVVLFAFWVTVSLLCLLVPSLAAVAAVVILISW